MAQKVGRNDPCPCGSGKKYKKCCEQRLETKKKFSATILSSGLTGGKATKISANFFNRTQEETAQETPPERPPEAEKPM